MRQANSEGQSERTKDPSSHRPTPFSHFRKTLPPSCRILQQSRAIQRLSMSDLAPGTTQNIHTHPSTPHQRSTTRNQSTIPASRPPTNSPQLPDLIRDQIIIPSPQVPPTSPSPNPQFLPTYAPLTPMLYPYIDPHTHSQSRSHSNINLKSITRRSWSIIACSPRYLSATPYRSHTTPLFLLHCSHQY